MSANAQKLGALLAQRMRQTAQANTPMGVELGSILDGSLTLRPDGLAADIPRREYSTLGEPELEAGDRVLVAWCGNEPVVLGKIVKT